MFHRVLPSFTECYWVLPSFTGCYWVLPSFTGCYWVLPSFTEFYRVLPSFTEFYKVLPSFSFFYLMPDRRRHQREQSAADRRRPDAETGRRPATLLLLRDVRHLRPQRRARLPRRSVSSLLRPRHRPRVVETTLTRSSFFFCFPFLLSVNKKNHSLQ